MIASQACVLDPGTALRGRIRDITEVLAVSKRCPRGDGIEERDAVAPHMSALGEKAD